MITKLKHHDNCEVRVEQLPHTHTHYARLKCVDHNTHIQWLNRQEAHTIASLTNHKDHMFTRRLFEEVV
jgi:hypothetical protein